MVYIITIAVLYLVYKAVSAEIETAKERKHIEQMNRIQAEQEALKEAQRLQRAEARAAYTRQLEAERELFRQKKEQEKQAEQLAKHEEQLAKHEKRISKLEFDVQQAQEDIYNLKQRYDDLQEKSEYLELERDSCVWHSKEWFKWNDKVMANNDKVYRIQKQMNKAYHVKKTAEAELEGVA